jgi:crotonobetainyl-CoA:carnitine CoA-transferase CaiB-like acyl-CoA transferase
VTRDDEEGTDARAGAAEGADESLPLSGIHVVELGHIVAGPFCGMVLADLGAEVTKVENPNGGDSTRHGTESGQSVFASMNRNKRSVAIDLGDDDGCSAFERLIADADVVVENFREGALDGFGVPPEAMRERNPELVVCSIKGFGDGPYSEYPALDPVAEAMGGLMSVTGREGMAPVRAGSSVADMTAALFGAVAILGALHDRERTGTGQHLRVPLFESTVTLMGYWLTMTDAFGVVPGPQGASHPNWAPYDVYETGDDEYIFVGPASERHWEALCEAIEAPALLDAPEFETLRDRRAHSDDLDERLGARIAEYDRETLLERLRNAGVPTAPVNDTRAVLDDDHLEATGFFDEIRWPSEATDADLDADVRIPGVPFTSSAFSARQPADPPALGGDTAAVLSELGYSDREIEALREQGAVR